MSRRSSRRSDEDEEEDMDVKDEEEEEESVPIATGRQNRKSRKRSSASQRRIADSDNEAAADEEEEEDDPTSCLFHSQAPEMSQDIIEVKANERNNLMGMSESQREKAIGNLTRLVLFKALAGESIDRAKACKEAGISDARISSAAFDEVKIRLQNCFAFELKRIPPWMEKIKGLPKAAKDRYYVMNSIAVDTGEESLVPDSHSKLLHSVHPQSAVEKGFLMVVLGFVYCKGLPRKDGSRWINDKHLYDLLHRLDENLPPEPPSAGARRTHKSSSSQTSQSLRHGTPDVDALLQKFVHREYLLKEKANAATMTQQADVEEESYFFTMGPRAVIEIGRKQVIYFCAEVMDEDISEENNPMLMELEQNDEDIDEMGMAA